MMNFKRKLFTSQRDYEIALIVLAVTYTFIMSFWFEAKWADSKWAISLIEKIGRIIPVVNNIKNSLPGYSNYIGLFYAGIWLLAPFTIYLGWMMEKNPNVKVINQNLLPSDPSHLFKYFVALGILIFLICMPISPTHQDWQQDLLTKGFFGMGFSSFIFISIPAYLTVVLKKIIKIILLKE
ncbi:MAG: hypothetical protein H6R05_1670 [Burkholderiaceae bacterium]|nr:hypothetical protein [Burkholderiaceae bacterium]